MAFAISNLGVQVGRGECWDLPATIMRKRGAGPKGYTFGKKVPWDEALPGDVLTTSKHVMVLVKPKDPKNQSRILHQNVGKKRFVIFDYLRNKESFTVWRPGRP